MRFCLCCRNFSGGGPLCTHCGRSFGGRLCRGRTRHLNPFDALFCNFCGTDSLQEGARSIPLGWISRFFIVAGLFFGGRWLLQSFTHVPDVSFQGMTGYKSPAVWLVEKFAHVIIILFVFYFLSSFMPGEAGKQFRAAMSNIVIQAIKLFFKVIERGLGFAGKLLMGVTNLEWLIFRAMQELRIEREHSRLKHQIVRQKA